MYPETSTGAAKMPAKLKMGLELGPAVLFFAAYSLYGLFVATGVIMATSLVSLAVAWFFYRRLPTVPLVSAVMVLIFGSITLILNDKTFIMMKPTVMNALFAAVLLGGVLFFDRPLLKVLFEEAFKLDETGWRKLTIRWGLMFLGLAVVNELVWRTQTEELWVKYKVFGQAILIFVFTMTQMPLMMRHELKPDGPSEA